MVNISDNKQIPDFGESKIIIIIIYNLCLLIKFK